MSPAYWKITRKRYVLYISLRYMEGGRNVERYVGRHDIERRDQRRKTQRPDVREKRVRERRLLEGGACA